MVLCLSNNARYNLESVFPNTDAFNTSYAYDKNGNLDSLNRHMGGNLIDELAYQYANGSNQLLAVADNGTLAGYTAGTGDYTYDLNGNMDADPSKSSDIEYNHLNLPQKVTFDNTDNVRYIYSAGGSKLRKAIADELGNVSTYFDYSGPFIYENDTLKAIFTSAGRIVPMDDNGEVLYKFEYNLQDHLGNTRVVFGGNDNGRPELLQTTDYYPFGMTMTQQNYFNADVLANKYLYNGKELQDDDVAGVKLDWYDYGARFYDPQLGRWHSVDPLAEDFNSWTPYHYVHNNPLIFIDPTGMSAIATKYVDEEGEVILDTDDGSDDVVIVPEEKKEEFEELINAAKEGGSLDDFDDPHWNDNMKATFLNYETIEDMEVDLSFASNKYVRQQLIEMIQSDNPMELLDVIALEWGSALTNPLNWIPSPIKMKGLNIKPPINRMIPSNNPWFQFNKQIGRGRFTKQKYSSSGAAKRAKIKAYENWKNNTK